MYNLIINNVILKVNQKNRRNERNKGLTIQKSPENQSHQLEIN